MTFWTRQNYGDSKRTSGCQALGEEGMNRWSTEGFSAVKLPCTTFMMGTHRDSPGKARRMHNIKSEP